MPIILKERLESEDEDEALEPMPLHGVAKGVPAVVADI
jgi:hypothetical protein